MAVGVPPVKEVARAEDVPVPLSKISLKTLVSWADVFNEKQAKNKRIKNNLEAKSIFFKKENE